MITFEDRLVALPSGRTSSIGLAGSVAFSNTVPGENDVLIGDPSGLSLESGAAGEDAIKCDGVSGFLEWTPASAIGANVLVAMVLDDWTDSYGSHGIGWPPGGATITALKFWDRLQTRLAGSGSIDSATVVANNGVHLFIGLAHGAQSQLILDEDVDTGTLNQVSFIGFQVGATAGANFSDVRCAALYVGVPDLDGETDAATITAACVQQVSNHFWPVFGASVTGLVEAVVASGRNWNAYTMSSVWRCALC